MNKRETIIIVLAGLLALYGLLDYFVLGNDKQGSAEQQIAAAATEAEAVTQKANANLTALKAGKGKEALAYIKTRAESMWLSDPFILYTGDSADQDREKEKDMPALIYSGFIQVGETILGVINGMEYSIGELILDAGYKVSQITPLKVVLVTQTGKKVTLYLQEE